MKKLITLLLLTIVAGCSNEDSNSNPESLLPAITQTGANTFGCLIDGKLFIPRDGTGTWSGNDPGLSYLGGYPEGAYNEIDIRDYKSEKTTRMLIHLHNLYQIGVADYIINESNGMSNVDGLNHTYLHCKVFNKSTNSYQYYRSFENSGTIKITRYDFTNGIVSGTFSCRVKNSSNPEDIIEITNGRFDINGYTLPNIVFP
ncbi:hypothetical protein [Flavobacterium sp. UBA7682]|uniref:hypothetical protein n=1 Tax=Flavobacterium sp. UBA7682 TaxID=1946560 RepID=UPI0025B7D494|nr:hypothetical protein [Flavobacterium sp. UBA7682]